MAERGVSSRSSRTAVRMAIGFMTNDTSMEAPPSREGVDDPTAVKEDSTAGREPRPRRRSARVNGVHSPGAAYRASSSSASPTVRSVTMAAELPPQLSTSPAEGERRTPPNEAALQHNSRVPIAIPAAGLHDGQQAEEEDLQTPHGDSTQANRWVRFAWEPLVVGETEHDGGRNSPVPTTSSGGGSGNGGSVPEIGGATPLQGQELSEGPAHQGDEMLGVKRFRASAGYREETARTDSSSSYNRLTRRAPTDRTDWGQPSLGWPRRHPSLREPRRMEFEVDAGPPRELAGATEVVGRPDAGSRGDAPLRAAGKRGGRGCMAGGISTRSSGWGGDAAMHATTQEELVLRQVETGGDGATAATMDRQYQEESESHEERGRSAKKPRCHRLKVQGTLSVSHVDSLTDGVSSLGVASPGATANSGGGKWKPVDASRRRRCVWRREALTGSTKFVLPSEPLCPILALGGVGWNDMRGATTTSTGAGASSITTTRYQKERPSAAVGGPGHHLSKKRRNCSLSTGGASSFR